MPNSPLLDLARPLAVVCHDAGAANLIFAWMRECMAADPAASRDLRLVAQGPAASLWSGCALPGVQPCDSVEAALDGAAALLSGTAWTATLEFDARVIAAAQAVHSVAVIDHWTNYRARFERGGRVILPDAIALTDAYAEAEAGRCLPGVPLLRYPNRYLGELVETIAALPSGEGDILYVLEPIAASWDRQQPGVFQALDYFVANRACIDPERRLAIRLRPHPSDPPGKYAAWIAAHASSNVALDDSPSLAESIARAQWVLGAETFAMVVGLAAGRRVVSTLPPWGHRCRLPHREIRHLRDLIAGDAGAPS